MFHEQQKQIFHSHSMKHTKKRFDAGFSYYEDSAEYWSTTIQNIVLEKNIQERKKERRN